MASEQQAGLLDDLDVVETVMARVTSVLGMLIDREFRVGELRAERVHERPAGAGQVHVSFRMAFGLEGGDRHAALLVPLPDALALAARLLCLSDEEVEEHRGLLGPDALTKDALLELGNMISGAVQDSVRELTGSDSSVSFGGCQGVRADVRPALEYTEGDELVVGRAVARIHEYPEFELILMFPALPGMA